MVAEFQASMVVEFQASAAVVTCEYTYRRPCNLTPPGLCLLRARVGYIPNLLLPLSSMPTAGTQAPCLQMFAPPPTPSPVPRD